MKDSGIFNIIELTKKSEKNEKKREKFLDYIAEANSDEPRTLLSNQIESMFQSVFSSSTPSDKLESLKTLVDEEDGSAFLEMFNFENRRFSTKLWEYKNTKAALDSYFDLIIYKYLTSDSSFCKNLRRIKDTDLPNMIGPMARPHNIDDNFESEFRLNSIDGKHAANQFFRDMSRDGILSLHNIAADDQINTLLSKINGYIYKDINTLGTYTPKGSFSMIGFKGEVYSPDNIEYENCIFPVKRYSLEDSSPIPEDFLANLQDQMLLWYSTIKGENVNSSVGLDVTFNGLLETLYVPLILMATSSDNVTSPIVYPVQLTIDKQGTSVYVNPLELLSVLSPLAYALQGIDEAKKVVDIYYDSARNSLIISSDFAFSFTSYNLNFETGLNEEYNNKVPFCGEVKCMNEKEVSGATTICAVDLTNLSPTITLKERLSDEPILVEYLEVPSKIYRENPGLKQFYEKQQTLLSIKNDKELYASLLAFMEKYVNTYAPLQKRTLVQQVGRKQKEGEAVVRWLDETKPQFNPQTNPNISKYVLQVRESYWQNNTSLDIEKTLAYFISQGNDSYYRLLSIQILGIDYLTFTARIISFLIDNRDICISDMTITEDTGLPMYYGVLPYQIEYTAEYASGNVYEKLTNLEEIESVIIAYFGSKLASQIINNQKNILEKSKPQLLQFRFGQKSDVIERFISNKELSKEQQKIYKEEELKTITLNVNDDFVSNYGNDTDIFGVDITPSAFSGWLAADGQKYIAPYIQVFTIEGGGFALRTLIRHAYIHPKQKGVFINANLSELNLAKRNYKTGETDPKTKKGIKIKIFDTGGRANSLTLSVLKSNKKGMTFTTRETLADWGYLDKDAKTYKQKDPQTGDEEDFLTVKLEDARRLWNILETIYYEKTSEIKVEGQRLYNLFIRSSITDRAIKKANNLWNSQFNNFAKPDYSAIPIIARHSYFFKSNTTTPFNLRGAQKQGLKFLSVYDNGGLLAHEVGFGKTTTAITKCSEMIMTGKARRILTIVPNVVYDNWIKEIGGGKDQEGNPIIGLLGNSVKVIPLGNLGLSDLRGAKRRSKTPVQKAIIKKDGKRKGVKTYFDEEDVGEFNEVGAIMKATEIATTVLTHIGQYSRLRGAKIPGGKNKKETKLENGGLLRYSDRSIVSQIQVETRGGSKTADVDVAAAEFNNAYWQANKRGEDYCEQSELVIGRRRFSGNADISVFIAFVEEVLAQEIPNYTQSPALSTISSDIREIAEDVYSDWKEKLLDVNSSVNKEFKSAYAYPNDKVFQINKYCGGEYENLQCELDGCGRNFNGWDSHYGVDQKPDFPFWINDEFTRLEKSLTDRVIWYFRKLRGTLVGKMGKWKNWAISDKAILIAKHSSIENIKVPQLYINQAIVDASDVRRIESAPDFYKGFSLPLRHNSIDIDDLNVDTLIVDEIHNYNRIIDKVHRRATFGEYDEKRWGRLFGKALNNKKEMQDVIEYSFKSNSLPTVNKFNLFSLAKYIQSRKKTHQNTILLSATPFTDDNYQMLSLFNMIDKNKMDSLGIDNAYQFYMKYVIEEWKWDINQRNQFGLFAKIEGYNNGFALSGFIKSFGNFKISDKEIERRRPIKYTISSTQQPRKEIKDVVSIIDLTEVQERMVKNISEYTNGNTTTVNEFGFDQEMLKKVKKGKTTKVTVQEYVDETKELELQERIAKIMVIEDFSTDAEELFTRLVNLNPNSLWVQTFKDDNPTYFEGDEDSTDETDASDAVKSGALDKAGESSAKAFRGQSLNLKLAISPYLISGNEEGTMMNPLIPGFTTNTSANAKNFVEQSPKIHYAVKASLELLLHHKKKQESPSGQVFYLNLVRFTYGGIYYNIFDLIKRYMVDICEDPDSEYFGLLEDSQVQSLDRDTTATKREEIKDGFLSGEVLILMGTETIKEGINLQENATIMYILNAEWSPVKMMQLQGRIWRQGNNWKNCFIINVLARKSLDAFVFSKLDKKITAVREMLDSDVYDMDATQFTMDAHQIKIELTTEVSQLVKIGWIEKEKVLESDRMVEFVKKRALESLKENYVKDVEDSESFKKKFNILSIKYGEALYDEMIKRIIKGQNKIRKDDAVATKQKSSKKPLTAEQIKKIVYKKITNKEAEKLIDSTEEYTPKYSHMDLEDSTLNYVVLSTQLKKLLDGLLIVDSEYINIKKIEERSDESVAGRSKEFKAQVQAAKLEFKEIKKQLDPDGAGYKLVDITKLSLGRRLIREMHELGYKSSSWRTPFYEVDFQKFETEVEKLIGGTGIAKTLSDYSVYVEGEGKNFSDIDSLIKKQERVYLKAEKLSQDEEGQKKILKKDFEKQMALKNDPKKKVDIERALKRFRKIFPLIEKK